MYVKLTNEYLYFPRTVVEQIRTRIPDLTSVFLEVKENTLTLSNKGGRNISLHPSGAGTLGCTGLREQLNCPPLRTYDLTFEKDSVTLTFPVGGIVNRQTRLAGITNAIEKLQAELDYLKGTLQ